MMLLNQDKKVGELLSRQLGEVIQLLVLFLMGDLSF